MKNVLLTFIILVIAFFILYTYSDIILQRFTYRLEERSLTSDSTRFYLYGIAIVLWVNSLFMGTGIGSESAVMETLSNGITATHNLLLEVLLQFGIIIFILFIVFL